MTLQFFSKNGALLPLSDAVIPIQNIAYQYGYGVYETAKIRNSILYFSDQHISRLMQSAALINLRHVFTHQQISGYISDLVKNTATGSFNLKILLIGGKEAGDAQLIIMPLAPLFPEKKLYTDGATVGTIQYERFMPNAKTLNMIRSYMYYTQAIQHGHYDMLFLDAKNAVLEGSRTNFFGITGTTLVTPPKKSVLEGVTRQTVIAAAKKHGYSVEEKVVPYATLGQFDGAFLTSTSSNIVPLVKIDDISYQTITPTLLELMRIYKNFIQETHGIFKE